MDQDAIGLVLLVKNQVFDYVLNEMVMFGVLKDGFEFFCRLMFALDLLAVVIQILSSVWQLLLSLEVVIQMFYHLLKILPLHVLMGKSAQ